MNTHTPGPWTLRYSESNALMDFPRYPDHLVDSAGKRIHFACITLTSADNERALANTMLIAAAPDLFAALRDIINDLPSRRDWLNPATEQLARAAIAKAEGKA